MAHCLTFVSRYSVDALFRGYAFVPDLLQKRQVVSGLVGCVTFCRVNVSGISETSTLLLRFVARCTLFQLYSFIYNSYDILHAIQRM